MAVITMPVNLRCASGCRIEQITTDSVGLSDPGGNSQARTYGVPRWSLSLAAPAAMTDADAGLWKAMLLTLRGSVNFLAAFDPSRPQPRGSLRGALTLASAAAIGASAIAITGGGGQAGKTLVIGDWLQIGTGLGSSQLVMCVAPATADGAGACTVTVEPPLRLAFGGGAAVTWDRPLAYFRKPPGRVGWSAYSRYISQSVGIDMIEAWA